VDLPLVPPATFRAFLASLTARDAELLEALRGLPPLAQAPQDGDGALLGASWRRASSTSEAGRSRCLMLPLLLLLPCCRQALRARPGARRRRRRGTASTPPACRRLSSCGAS